MNKKLIATGTIAALFLIGCGSSPKVTSDDEKRVDGQAHGVPENQGQSVEPAHIEAGDYKIGKKDDLTAGIISPGTYVITALSDGINCYWARLKNFDNDMNSIIANGNIDPGRNARVTVKSTDKGLKLENDCLAKKEK
jgi:small nuclear ribonucleoprotein (snRNP)-like protein